MARLQAGGIERPQWAGGTSRPGHRGGLPEEAGKAGERRTSALKRVRALACLLDGPGKSGYVRVPDVPRKLSAGRDSREVAHRRGLAALVALEMIDEDAEQPILSLYRFSDLELHPRSGRSVCSYQDDGDGSVVEMIEESRHIWSSDDVRVSYLIGAEDVEVVVKRKKTRLAMSSPRVKDGPDAGEEYADRGGVGGNGD